MGRLMGGDGGGRGLRGAGGGRDVGAQSSLRGGGGGSGPRRPRRSLRTRLRQEVRIAQARVLEMAASAQSVAGAYTTPQSMGWLAAGMAGVLVAYDITRFCVGSIKPDTLERISKLASTSQSTVEDAIGSEPTVIYDVKGRVVATLRGESTALDDVSDHMWTAVVASEDRRFFFHPGVDVRGIARAILTLGTSGGGSTITQQLVKNMLLSQDRTITRKVVEMGLAVAIERKLTKPQLLEEYLNNVYWGHGIYGVTSAAAAFFRKMPKELNLGESALLAAMLPAPEALSPYRSPSAALRARSTVLKRMVDTGYITEEERADVEEKGMPSTLALSPGAALLDDKAKRGVSLGVTPYRAPFFVSEVLYQLRDMCGEYLQRRGGLQIHTTLDLSLQERAEQLAREDGEKPSRGTPKEAGEAVIVAIDPQSGAVRVVVGGRDFGSSPYNRAVLAKRSPGSAFKPVVYLAALAEGAVTPTTVLEDEETQFDTKDDYTPQNFYKNFKGEVTLREALVYSLNIPTVKIADMIGIDRVKDMARRVGITSDLPSVLSLSLGACEVTPMEMAAMYATIAAGGVYSKPHLVTRVRDKNGNTLYRHKSQRRAAVPEDACREVHKMLRLAVTRGTGRAAAKGWQSSNIAGKTGTSDDYRDGWFCGYSPNLATVVWVGNDDNKSLLGAGAIVAAPLWARFMKSAQGAGVSVDKSSNRRRTSRWREKS